MLPRRRCPFCRRWFHPHPRLKQRQKTCGRPDCRHKQKQKSNQEWRTENPDYFRGVYALQKEIELMLKNGFKLEVEALISKDISYVTEEYVPARLEESEFLD